MIGESKWAKYGLHAYGLAIWQMTSPSFTNDQFACLWLWSKVML